MSKRRNSSAKGAALERHAKEILHALGYRRVHRAVRTPVQRGGMFFSNDNDVHGCFDLEAAKPGAKMRYVQVTTDEKVSARKSKVAPVAADFPIEHTDVEVWGWVGGRRRAGEQAQGFRIHRWGGVGPGWTEVGFLEKVSSDAEA